MLAMRSLAVLVSLSTLAALACAAPTTDPGATPPKAASPTSPSDETSSRDGEPQDADELDSVHPGINDRYFREGAVADMGPILERERRDVIAHQAEIVAALELRPGQAVADIGSGTGVFLAPLSAGVGQSGRVYAVDIVPAFLERLRERVTEEQLANVEVVAATPTDVSLAPASVDLLFVCDVYHHIEYPQVYLDTLLTALRPGGRLVIVEFDKVPGKISQAMMDHVRADKPTLIREVSEAGFVFVGEVEGLPLEENYMVVFEKAEG